MVHARLAAKAMVLCRRFICCQQQMLMVHLYGVCTSLVMRVTLTPGMGSMPSLRSTSTWLWPPPKSTTSCMLKSRAQSDDLCDTLTRYIITNLQYRSLTLTFHSFSASWCLGACAAARLPLQARRGSRMYQAKLWTAWL